MTQSTAVSASKDDPWRQQIKAMEPEFATALPRGTDVAQFIRAAQTAVGRDKELLNCDRQSLMQSLMQSAEVGLMPNGRDAALVRFKKTVQFLPMIGGILKLMRNTGEISSIVAEVVCENDDFDYEFGSNAYVKHKPPLNNRGAVKGAYAVVKTKDGAEYVEVMGRDEIEKIRDISAGYKFAENGPSQYGGGKKNSVWHLWFNEMARKTVLRRLAKRCPLSTDKLVDLTSRDDHLYDLSAVNLPRQPSQTEIAQAKLRGEPLPAPEDEPQDADFEEIPGDEDVPEDEGNRVKDDAPFKEHSDALASMEKALPGLPTDKDVDDFVEIWTDMVLDSFEDAKATITTGKRMAARRKIEIQKAAA